MKKAPKLWRRKKGGKHIGNWFVTVRDVPVNLGTKNADAALTRRTDALKGARKFIDDVEGAADDVVAATAPRPSPVETVLPPPSPDPAPPIVGPAAAPALPVDPPPSEPDPETWDQAVNAAAGEADEENDDRDAPPGAAADAKAEFVVTIEDIMKILELPAEQLAPAAVEIQIKVHESVADFFFGLELMPLPANHLSRAALAAGYAPCIRLMQLDKVKIHPGWLILGGSAMMLAAQIKGAKKKTAEPLRAVP